LFFIHARNKYIARPIAKYLIFWQIAPMTRRKRRSPWGLGGRNTEKLGLQRMQELHENKGIHANPSIEMMLVFHVQPANQPAQHSPDF
jgi:hypothetical protein